MYSIPVGKFNLASQGFLVRSTHQKYFRGAERTDKTLASKLDVN